MKEVPNKKEELNYSDLFSKLVNKWGEEKINHNIKLELEKNCRENGVIDKECLSRLENKIKEDNDFRQIFYTSVERRLRRREGGNKIKELKAVAMLDPLTGLLNRRAFRKEIMKRFAAIKRAEEGANPKKEKIAEENFWIFLVDVDNFKKVNDTYGHEVGDKVLIRLAKKMKSILREDRDLLARCGGDEFIIMVDGKGKNGKETKQSEILDLANRLRKKVMEIKIKGKSITISVGVVKYDKGRSLKKIRKKADRALYYLKGREIDAGEDNSLIDEDNLRNGIVYLDTKRNKYIKYKSK